jgi:hypothetical protein
MANVIVGALETFSLQTDTTDSEKERLLRIPQTRVRDCMYVRVKFMIKLILVIISAQRFGFSLFKKLPQACKNYR